MTHLTPDQKVGILVLHSKLLALKAKREEIARARGEDLHKIELATRDISHALNDALAQVVSANRIDTKDWALTDDLAIVPKSRLGGTDVAEKGAECRA